MDSLLLSTLSKQGIDSKQVSLNKDYGLRSLGKSHYAQTYQDAVSKKKFTVISCLPMVDAYGQKHELAWGDKESVFENGNNIFHGNVNGLDLSIITLSDQPWGAKKDAEVSFHPQLFIGGAEIKPVSNTPRIINDPLNENYGYNTLEWDYGVCLRRIRIIEGRFLGSWVFVAKPKGNVFIRYNQSGKLRLRLQYAYGDDAEFVPIAYFEESKDWPVIISDSLTFYPDADPETATVDGHIYRYYINSSWADIVAGAGHVAEPSTNPVYIRMSAGDQSGKWDSLYRVFALFDTSSLSGATISSAIMSVRGQSKADGNSAAPSLNTYSSNPASNTTLVAADYAEVGSTAFSDSPVAYADFSVTSYNDMSFNSAGLAAINKTGISKFSFRFDYDATGTEPNWVQDAHTYCRVYAAEQGADYQPKLVVTYTSGVVNYDISLSPGITISSTLDRDLTFTRSLSPGITSSVSLTKSMGKIITTGSELVASTTINLARGAVRSCTSNLNAMVSISRLLSFSRESSPGLTASVIISKVLNYIRSSSALLSVSTTIEQTWHHVSNYVITIATNLNVGASIAASWFSNFMARRFHIAPHTAYGSDVPKSGRYGVLE